MLPNEGKVSRLNEDKKEMLMAEKYLQFMVSYDMSSGWQKSSSCIKYLEILDIGVPRLLLITGDVPKESIALPVTSFISKGQRQSTFLHPTEVFRLNWLLQS